MEQTMKTQQAVKTSSQNNRITTFSKRSTVMKTRNIVKDLFALLIVTIFVTAVSFGQGNVNLNADVTGIGINQCQW